MAKGNHNHPPRAHPAKPLVLIGAGGHANVLASLLKVLGRSIVTIVDDDPAKHGKGLAGLTVRGTLDAVGQLGKDEIELVNAVGSAHRPAARQAVYDRFASIGYTFATLAHPAASVAPEADLQPGAHIMASATVQAGAALHANCLINTGALIDHDTTIGSHTHIAPGATICGGVTIGPGCHIGAGATVVQGVTLGPGVVVGAGATVLDNLAKGLVAVGTPARPLP